MSTRILIVASLAESLVNFRGPLIQSLVHAGHSVHAAAPMLSHSPELREKLIGLGAIPHEILIDRTGVNPLADLRSFVSLWRLYRAVEPKIVLAYTIKPVIWGGIAARLARVPSFFALITGLGYAFTGKPQGSRAFIQHVSQFLYRISFKGASGVFFQNPDDAAEFANRGILPGSITPQIVNGSGIDTVAFAQAPLPDGPIRFLLIARLLEDKGIREFARAAKALKDLDILAEFHLVGPVDTNPTGLSENTVKKWHDDGILVWHGSLSDVRPVISSAHVYVLPSYREGTPRSVLEAMSMGRPVITTDAPGCRETVVDGINGFLVPVRESEAVADAMRKFIDSPHLISQMGAQSRRIAEEKYDVRKVNAQMMEAMGL